MTTNAAPKSTSILRLLVALQGMLILGFGTARAVLHVNDLSGMRHIGGIWMTLAQYLNNGVFYPPLEENGYYAGTRYMPLLFCLIAGVEQIVGDYLLATKLLALVTVIALAAGIFAVVLRITKRRLDALALAGLILAFPQGSQALLSPHADALAVALSVWGLFVVAAETPRRGRLVVATLLFALAFGTKFSAEAAPAAAVLSLFARQRKASVGLLIGYGLLVLVGLGVISFASQGRFVENFRALAGGGMNLETVRIGPARLIHALTLGERINFVATLMVVGLALLTLFQNFTTRGFTLWDWYFLTSIATTLLIFTSPGTDANHLLELETAAVLVVAQRLAGTAPGAAALTRPAAEPVTWIVLGTAMIVGGSALGGPLPDEALSFATLAAQLPPHPHLLTEDATPVVLLGQRPVVMDAFAFRILAERGLIDDQALVERILRREFNGLILLRRVEDPNEPLTAFHFGPRVTDALRQAYRFDRQVGQYYLYLPAPAERGGGPADKK